MTSENHQGHRDCESGRAKTHETLYLIHFAPQRESSTNEPHDRGFVRLIGLGCKQATRSRAYDFDRDLQRKNSCILPSLAASRASPKSILALMFSEVIPVGISGIQYRNLR